MLIVVRYLSLWLSWFAFRENVCFTKLYCRMIPLKLHLGGYRFFLKRAVLLVSIIAAGATGFIPSQPTGQVAAYYSSFQTLALPTVEPHLQLSTPPLHKRLAIVSDEVIQSVVPSPTPTPQWGKARQVDAHTWTIDVGKDSQMGSPQEILAALNVYRQAKGKGTLTMDMKLLNFAQQRADSFAAAHNLDGHAGFEDFIHNQNGFDQLGFYALGENSSYGYQVNGTHLIEWVYAGDKPHDDNQLSSDWSYVGIGVSGLATDLVFGGSRK